VLLGVQRETSILQVVPIVPCPVSEHY